MRTVWFIAFLIVYLVKWTLSQCNVCSCTTSVACVSETEFRLCFEGSLLSETASCPVGTICTNTNYDICTSDSIGISPTCIPSCGKCGADGRFACLNETHLTPCFGNLPSSLIVPCPDNTVCNNNLLNFCGDPAVTIADCNSGTGTSTTTTTSKPPLCSGPGRFPLESEYCKQYVYCFYNNFELRSQNYTCQGTTIFNPVKQQCVVPSSEFNCS